MKSCDISICDNLAPNRQPLCSSCKSQTTLYEYNETGCPSEEWLDIPGFSGYQVSDQGSVRSLSRAGVWRCLSPFIKREGYVMVQMGRGVKQYVHRLVALAFIPNPKPYTQTHVHHQDANRKHNCVDNLQWTTPTENYRLRDERREPRG